MKEGRGFVLAGSFFWKVSLVLMGGWVGGAIFCGGHLMN